MDYDKEKAEYLRKSMEELNQIVKERDYFVIFMLGLVLFFIGLCTYQVNAEPAPKEGNWFCEEESGKRDGNTIWACGVGEATLEHLSRKYALDHAIEEFNTLCQISSDCRGKKTSVEPKRMTCYKNGIILKCYRLIQVTID